MTALSHRHAIILAAGLGKRMRPLTDTIPKPLVKVGDKCLIDHALDFVVSAGISDVVVNTHYLAPLLQAHLAARTNPHIRFSHEETLLETGGGIYKALPMLGDQAFFAANSDTICVNGTEHALARMEAAWDDNAMDGLLLLHPVQKAVGYDGAGDFSVVDGMPVRRAPDGTAPFVFTGIQMLHPRLFASAPPGAFSLNLLYNQAIEQGRIRALIHDGKWLHVGEPSSIPLAEKALA